MRTCIRCETIYENIGKSFRKTCKRKDGIDSVCKKCRSKQYYRDKDKRAAEAKRYREKYKEEIRLKKKEYYQKNKEAISKKTKEKRLRDKAKGKRKVGANSRKRLRNFIKKKGFEESTETCDMVGCSYDFLMKHLKKTFEKNYMVEWKDEYLEYMHIDHIKPLSKAENKYQAVKLNHYTNLQFLYSKDNLKKGSSYYIDLSVSLFYEDLAVTNPYQIKVKECGEDWRIVND